MTVRDLMKQLLEFDPETRIGVNAHSRGCDITRICVYERKGKENKIDFKATPSQRPNPLISRDFVFSKDDSGDAIVIIST